MGSRHQYSRPKAFPSASAENELGYKSRLAYTSYSSHQDWFAISVPSSQFPERQVNGLDVIKEGFVIVFVFAAPEDPVVRKTATTVLSPILSPSCVCF
jgi:hypothetical protein